MCYESLRTSLGRVRRAVAQLVVAMIFNLHTTMELFYNSSMIQQGRQNESKDCMERGWLAEVGRRPTSVGGMGANNSLTSNAHIVNFTELKFKVACAYRTSLFFRLDFSSYEKIKGCSHIGVAAKEASGRLISSTYVRAFVRTYARMYASTTVFRNQRTI